jgi:crotonobetainyl-CoA:carnitine CoA-transferase CaiB-like acyl-CoA transferase
MALYRHANHFVFCDGLARARSLRRDPVGPSAAHRLYKVSDGWVLISVEDQPAWSELCRVLGTEDLISSFAAPQGLTPDGPAAERLARVLEGRTTAKLRSSLGSIGVAVVAVRQNPELLQDEYLREVGLLQPTSSITDGEQPWVVSNLVSFTRRHWKALTPVKGVGADNHAMPRAVADPA